MLRYVLHVQASTSIALPVLKRLYLDAVAYNYRTFASGVTAGCGGVA